MNVTAVRARVGGVLAESVSDNPVVAREFRTRMRGWKSFAITGGYALFLAAVLFIAYADAMAYSSNWQYHQSSMSMRDTTLGMDLFRALNWTQAILLALVIPALTFGSLTQEVERKTIEMLALTRLTAGKIVIGKHLSGFFYALMLLVSSVPLAAMCLMFGGISPAEIAATYAVLLVFAFFFASVGVFWSSLFNRTATAALFAYGTCALFMYTTYWFGESIVVGPSASVHSQIFAFAVLNPGWLPAAALESANVCGLHVPVALAAGVMMALTSWLLLLVASTHVRHHSVERALPIRLLVLAITIVGEWLIFGSAEALGLSTMASYLMSFVSPFMGMIMVGLCLAASVFATGEVSRRGSLSVAEYALSVWKMFRGEIGGAIGFMTLWAIVANGVFCGSLYWALAVLGTPMPAEVLANMARMSAATVAVVIGVSAFGVLVSSMMKLRRNAAASVVLLTIFLFVGYLIVLAYWERGVSNPAHPIWQLAALWPLTPLFQLTDDWRFWPELWWRAKESWMVVGSTYILLAMVALGIASKAAPKFGGVREE